MAEDVGGEKTLPASQHKIQKAREEGNVSKSQDLTAAWSLLVALAALWYLGPDLFEAMLDASRYYLGQFSELPITRDTAWPFAIALMTRLAWMVLPFALVMVIAGTAMNVVQVGFLFAPKAIQPKFNRLNPITGMQRFFNVRSVVELVKSIAKLVIISVVVYVTVRDRWSELLNTSYMYPAVMSGELSQLVALVWFRAVLVMLVIGLLDFAYQRWQYGRDLMMTAQEAKEEVKELEGDPRIKQRIRQIQRQLAMKRMMAEVPKADVIITNPVRFAVALRYDVNSMDAPVVIAKGARLVAQRIREIAEEHRVPIVEKPELARALYKNIEVGQAVPEHLFRAVAEVLAFVYRIDQREEKRRERGTFQPQPARA